jgi:hypothetical protein
VIAGLLRAVGDALNDRADAIEAREQAKTEAVLDLHYAREQLISHATNWARDNGQHGTHGLLLYAVQRYWKARDAIAARRS